MFRRVLFVSFAAMFAAKVAAAQDILTRRRDDNGWDSYRTPAPPRGLQPVPGTGSAAIYDRRGRRVGTVDRGPTGSVVRDNRGRRQ